jgi:hypothetical protein
MICPPSEVIIEKIVSGLVIEDVIIDVVRTGLQVQEVIVEVITCANS